MYKEHYFKYGKLRTYKNPTNYWTPQAIDCYNRGCNCSGCIMPKIMESECLMKITVIELIKKIGKPVDNVSKLPEREKAVHDAILDGADSYIAIEKTTGLKPYTVKEILKGLYKKAELEGASLKVTRTKFKDYINWLRTEYHSM